MGDDYARAYAEGVRQGASSARAARRGSGQSRGSARDSRAEHTRGTRQIGLAAHQGPPKGGKQTLFRSKSGEPASSPRAGMKSPLDAERKPVLGRKHLRGPESGHAKAEMGCCGSMRRSVSPALRQRSVSPIPGQADGDDGNAHHVTHIMAKNLHQFDTSQLAKMSSRGGGKRVRKSDPAPGGVIPTRAEKPRAERRLKRPTDPPTSRDLPRQKHAPPYGQSDQQVEQDPLTVAKRRRATERREKEGQRQPRRRAKGCAMRPSSPGRDIILGEGTENDQPSRSPDRIVCPRKNRSPSPGVDRNSGVYAAMRTDTIQDTSPRQRSCRRQLAHRDPSVGMIPGRHDTAADYDLHCPSPARAARRHYAQPSVASPRQGLARGEHSPRVRNPITVGEAPCQHRVRGKRRSPQVPERGALEAPYGYPPEGVHRKRKPPAVGACGNMHDGSIRVGSMSPDRGEVVLRGLSPVRQKQRSASPAPYATDAAPLPF